MFNVVIVVKISTLDTLLALIKLSTLEDFDQVFFLGFAASSERRKVEVIVVAEENTLAVQTMERSLTDKIAEMSNVAQAVQGKIQTATITDLVVCHTVY